MFAATREATVQSLLRHLLAMPAGAVATYEDLARVAGEGVDPSFHPLRKAIRLARDKHGVLLRNERGVGFARVGSFEERRNMLESRRGRVRRQALTGMKEVGASIRGQNVSQAEMLELTRYQGAFGVAHMATGGSQATAKKIVGEAFAAPPPGPHTLPR
jgi:hypothetical protein